MPDEINDRAGFYWPLRARCFASSPYFSAFLIVRDAQILADKLDKIIREGSPLLVRTLFGRFT